MTRVILALTLLALAGCGEMHFTALSPPPPGATAELDDEDGVITISRGAALAFECTHTMDVTCGAGTVASGDDAIAAAMVGYADSLVPVYTDGSQPRTVFVVVGKQVGETELELSTQVGDATLTVEVVD